MSHYVDKETSRKSPTSTAVGGPLGREKSSQHPVSIRLADSNAARESFSVWVASLKNPAIYGNISSLIYVFVNALQLMASASVADNVIQILAGQDGITVVIALIKTITIGAAQLDRVRQEWLFLNGFVNLCRILTYNTGRSIPRTILKTLFQDAPKIFDFCAINLRTWAGGTRNKEDIHRIHLDCKAIILVLQKIMNLYSGTINSTETLRAEFSATMFKFQEMIMDLDVFDNGIRSLIKTVASTVQTRPINPLTIYTGPLIIPANQLIPIYPPSYSPYSSGPLPPPPAAVASTHQHMASNPTASASSSCSLNPTAPVFRPSFLNPTASTFKPSTTQSTSTSVPKHTLPRVPVEKPLHPQNPFPPIYTTCHFHSAMSLADTSTPLSSNLQSITTNPPLGFNSSSVGAMQSTTTTSSFGGGPLSDSAKPDALLRAEPMLVEYVLKSEFTSLATGNLNEAILKSLGVIHISANRRSIVVQTRSEVPLKRLILFDRIWEVSAETKDEKDYKPTIKHRGKKHRGDKLLKSESRLQDQ